VRTAKHLAAAAIAIGIFAFAWLYRFNDPGGSFAFLTDDHFFYVVRGWQILFGELPVRDFVDHGAPLTYYTAAAVQIVGGRGTASEIAFCVTVLAVCAGGVFLLAARASGSWLFALSAAGFYILLEPRLYNYPKIAAYVLAIPALWACADRLDVRRIAVVSLVTVIAFLFRHDHGVFIAAAFAVLVAIGQQAARGPGVRAAVTYAAIVAVILLPYLLFLQLHGGVISYFDTAAEWAARDRARAEVEWPGLLDTADASAPLPGATVIDRGVSAIRSNRVAWVYYGELLLPFVALGLLASARDAYRPDWANARIKIGVVIVLGMMLNAGFLRSPLEARLADPSVPHAILIAWMAAALVAVARLPAPLWRKAVVCGGGAAFLSILAVAVTYDLPRRLEKAWMTDGLEAALERVAVVRDRELRAFPIAAAATSDPDDVLALSLYLRACTRPTDRVFMQHYLPQVVALAERGFAGGHADLRPGFFEGEAMQQLTVSRLSRQSVPVALVGGGDTLGGFRQAFPIVTAYFDRHYVTGGERSFGDDLHVRLLVRRDRVPSGTFPLLGWPCYQ
jgi:hypothetical protein